MEKRIEPDRTYNYPKDYPLGAQYITRTTELKGIENNKYDFLLSCHRVEHVSDPIKALKR